MKKAYRVRKNQEFTKIIAKKHTRSSKNFVIHYDTRALDHSRIGISVSKKLGNAVIRNKVKRQVREMVKDLDFYELPHDYIIIVRKGYFEGCFADNKKDLEKTIKACRII